LDESANKSLSRRRIFRRAAGVAAVGAAGGLAVREFGRSPALAAGGTTVGSGGVAPAVVMLTDGATVAVDASLGNDFRLTLGGNNHTIASPSNPTDGQKLTLQITQGTGGPYQVTWGSAYEFASSLPQPTLSTTAGLTDLVGFIYNANKGTWLMAGFLNGFITPVGSSPSPTPSATATPTPTPTPTQTSTPPGTYRFFPSTNGPTAAEAYSGPFLAGLVFQATAGGTWLEGFWWWVASANAPTAPQKFALWAVYSSDVGTVVPGTVVTSGALTAGQWNYIALPAPVALAQGACYTAATGLTGGFPDTNNQWAAGQPHSGGLVSGPLMAYSDSTGTNPAPFNMPQGAFSVASADPSKNLPSVGSNSANFWIDVQVTTSPPAGASYRLWPGYPTLPGQVYTDTSVAYTLGTDFKLSQPCALNKIWLYSPPGATVLPTQCGIWNTATQSVVSGTNNTSPTWSGAAGSGWVSCSYSGATLPAGEYRVGAYHAAGAEWFQASTSYWGNGGPAANGITAGPLSAPNTASTSPGQSPYFAGAWGYPNQYGAGSGGETFWLDVEVTPS
jgi:hypothetical protein